MSNKIIGLIVIALFNYGILAFAFIVEGAAGSFMNFMSLPSFFFCYRSWWWINIYEKAYDK